MTIRLRPSFNLIGPGRLGRTLSRLWNDAGCIEVKHIVGRQPASAEAAREFIGAGRVVELAALRPAEITLLAVPDDQLADLVAQLRAQAAVAPGGLVFHCSGALASGVLAPLAEAGARIASIHPLKSFAAPARAMLDFAGTCCGGEGDAAALAELEPLFAAIGGRCFRLEASRKTLYHAGAVLACNTLTALMEAALQSLAAAGLPREAAWPALRPLLDGTLDNIGALGTAAALTGPLARGDANVVAAQLQALTRTDPALAEAYRSLSLIALQLAAGQLEPGLKDRLARTLAPPPHAGRL